MSERIRVGYAPSPTGYLHIGNAGTALFNYLFVRHYNGDFVVHIGDIDSKKNLEDGESSQFDGLKWLGLDWDESTDEDKGHGPYRQSKRTDIHNPLIQQLLDEDKTYKYYMTEEKLEEGHEAQVARGEVPWYGGKHAHLTEEQRRQFEAEGHKPIIYFRVSKDKTYTFDNMVKGKISLDSNNIGDWVIVRKGGVPTYNFAVAADDHYTEISGVIRGDGHVSNIPKQLMVYEVFGWEPPRFARMSLVVNEQCERLSKRDGQILQSIEQYRDLGYLPEALSNLIALLGWSPEGGDEIFSKKEFIKVFDEQRLSRSPAMFDRQKLAQVNDQYMKTKDTEAVFELALPHLIKANSISEDPSEGDKGWEHKLTGLYQKEMSYVREIILLSGMFFHDMSRLGEGE